MKPSPRRNCIVLAQYDFCRPLLRLERGWVIHPDTEPSITFQSLEPLLGD